MVDRQKRMVIAICGAGHSGSTLLGLVLGSHSCAAYVGEAKRRFATQPKTPMKRHCKLCGDKCEIWGQVPHTAPPTTAYEILARATGKSAIIDSTKEVEWICARGAELRALGIEHKLVFLVRDGRGVLNSRLRKYSDVHPERLIGDWMGQITATQAVIAQRPGDAILVRYEKLATDPENTVKEICDFLGWTFEPEMLRYESRIHHPLGGNIGTQSIVARSNGIAMKLPNRSRPFYGELEGGFVLDLRWKRELAPEMLAIFEERAGAFNEPFRWEQSR